MDKSMKDIWSLPIVKMVEALKQIQPLIPSIIRDQYASIVGEGSRYEGLYREMICIGDVEWD